MMNGDPFRLILENQIDLMALTASPEATATLPVDNLKNPWRSRVMRSQYSEADSVTQTILGNSPSKALIADGFSISNHHLGGMDAYRIELFEGENQSGEVVYDSRAQSAAVLIPLGVWMAGIDAFGATYSDDLDKITTVWFEPVVYRSFRLTLKSFNNTKGFIQLGMIYLGKSIKLDYNFDWGNVIHWDDGLKLQRTEGGSLITESKRSYANRELTLNLSNMTDNDRNLLAGKIRKSTGKPILISAYPTQGSEVRRTEYTMIAKIAPHNPYSHVAYNQHSTQLTFLEI